MKTLSKYTLIFLSLLILAGCAKVPTEAIESARVSLQTAGEAESDLYLPELYQAAADSFAAAEAEIAVQEATSAITRNYGRVEALLAFVTQAADSSLAATEAAKEQMAVENEGLLLQAEAMLAQVQDLMGRAPRGKDGVIALASIGTDATEASSTAAEARIAQAEGRIYEARELTRTAMDQATALIAELESAIGSVQSGPRS